MGNGIFSKVDTALVLDFLHLKGHEHGKALGGEGTESIDLSCAKGSTVFKPSVCWYFNTAIWHIFWRDRDKI